MGLVVLAADSEFGALPASPLSLLIWPWACELGVTSFEDEAFFSLDIAFYNERKTGKVIRLVLWLSTKKMIVLTPFWGDFKDS